MPAKKRRTLAETARELGVSERTLSTWQGEGCNVWGTIESIQAWRTENKHPLLGGPKKRTPGERLALAELDEAEQRARVNKLEETAYYLKLKNDAIERNLVAAAEVREQVGEIKQMIADSLQKAADDAGELFPETLEPLTRQNLIESFRNKLERAKLELKHFRITGLDDH